MLSVAAIAFSEAFLKCLADYKSVKKGYKTQYYRSIIVWNGKNLKVNMQPKTIQPIT